ncbi:MAG: hypothetical protein H6600_07000 [Flavobacteriales bacterium]|nr:hypothetical protein [Flavobacteriales bacterium]
MREEELNEIKNRVLSTTKGPWISWVEGRDHDSGDSFIMTGIEKGQDIRDDSRGEDIYLSGATISDLDFIAHARQDIPKLLSYISELKQQLEKNK